MKTDDELKRRLIEELENLRLERYLIIERKMVKALRAGRPLDSKFTDLSGMKERYLEALDVYDSLGLTPRELYEKRCARAWLSRPGEKIGPTRIETISMFLHRLEDDSLARREREGRTFRYFIIENGRKRLSYYKNRGKDEKKSKIYGEKSWDKQLFGMLLLNSMMIGEMKNRHALIEKFSPSLNPNSSATYFFLWKKIEDLLDAIFFLMFSNFLGSPNAMRFAVEETNMCLNKLQDRQNVMLATAIYYYRYA